MGGFVNEWVTGIDFMIWLTITWRKDQSLADLDNLPDPDTLAEEIVENLEAGLESFKAIIAGLNRK